MTPDGVTAEMVESACRLGIPAMQLRDKSRSKEEVGRLARPVASIARKAGCFLSINTYLDIALEIGADGVHLPEGMELDGECNLSLSRSVHSMAYPSCDLLFFGPIFSTPSKRGPPQGIRRLEEFCRTSPVPVVAIGGIDRHNLPLCFDCGVAAVAVQRAVANHLNHPGEIDALLSLL